MKQIKKKIIIKNPDQPCEYNDKNICIHCGKSLRETLQSLQDMLKERRTQITIESTKRKDNGSRKGIL